jgi:hypothetical protein
MNVSRVRRRSNKTIRLARRRPTRSVAWVDAARREVLETSQFARPDASDFALMD